MKNRLCMALSMAAIVVACDRIERGATNSAAAVTPGNVLTLSAPGCVAAAADGKPFALPASAAGSDVLIPTGTRFTGECFSTAVAK